MTELAAYNFDEASGAVVDVSGNGHGFTPVGNTARTASGAGHTDKGLTQSSASIDAGASLFGQTTARTVMMWLKMSADFTGWVMEWQLTSVPTGVWGLLCLSGSIGFRGRNTGGTTQFASMTRPTDNAWHHYAGTFDPVDNKVRLYFDGVLTITTAALSGGIGTNATALNIFDTTLGSPPIVDDVRVYDVALDATTITTLMGTPVASGGTTGSVAVTQANQTSAAWGQLGYAGTSARTEAADTSSATGTVINPVTGTSAAAQANQTSSASGQLGYSGTSARTQAANASSASGQLGYSGTSTRTQADQTSTASGSFTAGGSFSGTVAVTQAANTASASGTFTPGSITGSAAVTQANQTGSASGQLGYSGTSSRTQANQTSTASGTVVNPVTGTASPVQANQASVATGKLGYTGTSVRVQANQTSAATGAVSGPISGTGTAVQANQTASIAGYFTPLVAYGTASGAVGAVPQASAATTEAPSASAGSMTVPSATGG